MRARRNPADWIDDHLVPDDGLLSRPSGRWARDKLGILAMYVPRFTQASTSARQTYFVDGLAGPGICRVADPPQFVRGSTLIALSAAPPFSKCIAMDLEAHNVSVLRRRTEHERGRCVVERGDVNQDILRLMSREIDDTSAPLLVFLDPEGFEVDWATITALSKFRTGARKAELLILAMSSSVTRVAGRYDPSTEVTRLDWALPPGPGWRVIYERQQAGELTSEQARQLVARLYEESLTNELGYAHVVSRAITRTGSRDGSSYYHLVFASDHPAGLAIMSHAFDTVYTNPQPASTRRVPDPAASPPLPLDFG